jgi:O-antigen biosynthesis protein
MRTPIKVVDIELSRPLEALAGLEGYFGVQALVRLHGAPIGYVRLPVIQGGCPVDEMSKNILKQHREAILTHLIEDGISLQPTRPLRMAELLSLPHPTFTGGLPSMTVAVCTRNRAEDLALCLEALVRLDYPDLDIVVVDNAPSDDSTRQLVDRFPQVRYACEPRPGLDWARNRAVHEARGEIVAYTDDDVVVDAGWARAIGEAFAVNPEAMAVTGLVVPYELETEAQLLFETYGGFGRGFDRKVFRVSGDEPVARWHGGAGRFGTGANMAYRRAVFTQIGLFDPALDVGTVTNGGGDLEMFFRVLKEGHALIYEPRAMVRHRHRRDYAKLRTQIMNNGVGLYSHFMRCAMAYPDERAAFLRLGIWWLWWWDIRRLLISLYQPWRIPRDLILAELWGTFLGLTRYQQARIQAAKLAGGRLPSLRGATSIQPGAAPVERKPAAVRTVDLSLPLPSLDDIGDYQRVKVVVLQAGQLITSFEIVTHGRMVDRDELRRVIAHHAGVNLVQDIRTDDHALLWATAIGAISRHYTPDSAEEPAPPRLLINVPVSIVIGTYDRPENLRVCLRSLVAQRTARPLEIIVVDNHPASGLTPPVVDEFPQIRLVREERAGVSYSRNAGILACSGEIVVTTDDDVIVPPDWLENLVAPFTRADVMAVTGNVLPLELETKSQDRFEIYGGLSRGFKRQEIGIEWFEWFRHQAVPTWELGGTANSAYRRTIFDESVVGLMDEVLGPGTPTGVGEDTDLFYRVLQADYTIIYEPTAYIWHQHRRTDEALERQIYGYSKGHVSYLLKNLLAFGDGRSLVRIVYGLPYSYLWRIKQRLSGRERYPIRLMLLELRGNLAGPWVFWQSHRRVRRIGRSRPVAAQPGLGATSISAKGSVVANGQVDRA